MTHSARHNVPWYPAGTGLALAALLAWGWVPAAAAGSRAADDGRTQGEVAYYNGNFARAADEYRRYLSAHDGDQAALLDLTAVLMEDGRPAEAARLLEQHNLHGFELGAAYLAAGDYKRANVELITSLRTSGPQWRTRMLLGLVCSLQGQHGDAVEYYWQALNEDARQPTVHLLLARSLAALGEDSSNARDYFRQRAREEYLRALKSDPSLWQVHGDLAKLYEDERQFQRALQEWGRVREVIGRAPLVEEAVARIAKAAAGPAPAATPTAAATPTPLAAVTPAPVPKISEEEEEVPAPRRPVATLLRNLRVQPLSHPDDPVIRVGLSDNLASLSFGCSGGWVAKERDGQGRHFWEGVGGNGYRLVRDKRGRWHLKSWEGKTFKRLTKPIVIAPLNPTQVMGIFNLYQSTGYFWGGGWRATRYYRGRLLVIPQGRQLQLINLVPLEDYLASVVPAEMPANWPPEALKAQAVAARSDTLSRRGTHGGRGYDVCNTPHCCAYDGVAGEDPRALEAITATAGQVLYRKGQLVSAFYSHACGGVTQDYEDAWGQGRNLFADSNGIVDAIDDGNSASAAALPFAPRQIVTFLTTQPDVLCADARFSGKASFRWIKVLSRAEMNSLLSDRYQVGDIRELRVEERTRSSYVRALGIEGEKGRVTVRGDRIRTLLGGLRSNLFVIQPITDPEKREPLAWVVWGGGWGHGVGFCQSGAAAMGGKGFRCADILQHYFPGANLCPVPWRDRNEAVTQTARDGAGTGAKADDKN